MVVVTPKAIIKRMQRLYFAIGVSIFFSSAFGMGLIQFCAPAIVCLNQNEHLTKAGEVATLAMTAVLLSAPVLLPLISVFVCDRFLGLRCPQCGSSVTLGAWSRELLSSKMCKKCKHQFIREMDETNTGQNKTR